MMNTKMRSLLLAISLTIFSSINLVSAQTVQTSPASNDPLVSLPASDVVGFLDCRRLINEIVPLVLSKDPAMLARMIVALDEVNKKTGVNIRSIERIAVGLRFYGATFDKVNKADVGIAIIVHGNFDPGKFILALKRETKGKVTEERYGGKIIYSEPMPAPPKKRAERETPAIAVLDANSLVLGDLPQVRATIDASASGNGRADASLVQLATRDAGGLVGGAGNVPDSLKQSFSDKAPKDEMAQPIIKLVNGIKQLYVSLGANATAFNFTVGARFESVEQAQSASDMLLGLRQQFGSQIPDEQARAVLDSMQITAQGDELQLRTEIKNEIVQGLVASFLNDNKPKVIEVTPAPTVKPAPKKTKPTTKSRKSKRRRRS
jgi:hypothetical protein